jgi:hypothetical protein
LGTPPFCIVFARRLEASVAGEVAAALKLPWLALRLPRKLRQTRVVLGCERMTPCA